jgi:zinc protease
MNYPNRSIQPPVNLVDRINLRKPVVTELQNGIPVFLIDVSEQDLIKLEFSFKAGSWYEKEKLTASFTSRMLREGTVSYSAREIADRIDYYGAILDTNSDKDMSYITLYTLNKHLSNLLPVFAEVIQKPVFPEYELEIMKQNRRQHFLVNNEKVRYVAKRKFNELIFGKGHPYGKVFTETDFEHVQSATLKTFHHQFYNAGNCRIIASGKIPENLIALLNDSIRGIWSGENFPDSPAANHPLSGETRKVHIKKENAVQTAIRVGKVIFNKTHPDYLKMKVLNTLLGVTLVPG